MSRKRKTHSASPVASAASERRGGRRFFASRANAALHLESPSEPAWRWLPRVLLAAFLLRAIVALSGDFVIHPDEVMQYLEPAHNAAFGAGVSYWEFFYGARSWLTPGLVAGALLLADAVGLGEPRFYIPLVKLMFCALSLLVPLGMYVFSRRHFGETTARAALILGAFWYELAAFAHKPMTEFTATALLFAMLALVRERPAGTGRAVALAAIAALVAAIRIQYAPVAGLILLAEFARTDSRAKVALLASGLAGVFAVGLFEKITWGGWFHSYLVNVRMNLIVGAGRVGETTFWQFPIWLAMASCGLAAFALIAGATQWRRRGWVLLLALAVLLPHMTQNHREYRFVFAAIPLWLLLLADFSARDVNLQGWIKHRRAAACMGAAALVSLVGIFNGMPWLSSRFDPNSDNRFNHVYRSFSVETGIVGFLRDRDPHFAAFRKLAADDSVEGVMAATRPYFGLGGYYYLHRAVPLYDAASWRELFPPLQARRYASHIIAGPPLIVEEARRGESGMFLVARKPGESELASGTESESDSGSGDSDSGSGDAKGTGGVGEFVLFGVGLPAFVADAESGRLVYWDQRGESAVLDAFELDADVGGGEITLWRAKSPGGVAEWKSHRPISAGLPQARRIVGPDAPEPPQKYGVEFAE